MDNGINRPWAIGYPSVEKPGPSTYYGDFYEWEAPPPSPGNDLSQLESGLRRLNLPEMEDYYYFRYHPEVEESVDPRLLALLEYLRELYMRREELVKNTFPGLHDRFVDLYKQIGDVLGQIKSHKLKAPRTMQRSLSFGSPRTPSGKQVEPELKLRRMKLKTMPDFDYPLQPGGPAGGDITNPVGFNITSK